MKKKLLKIALFLPILGFSYEMNFNKSFSKNVNSDILVSNVNITVVKQDEKSVNSEIEKFNNFLKNTKYITIENMNYNLTPKYEYVNNKSIFKGYIGDSRFSIESEDATNINKFLNDLVELKDSLESNDLKLNISNLSWELSNKLQNKVIDELRLESLIWVENYARELSQKVSKKCEVKNVNINEDYGYITPKNRMLSVSMDSASTSFINTDISPLNSEQNIKINTNYILDCK